MAITRRRRRWLVLLSLLILCFGLVHHIFTIWSTQKTLQQVRQQSRWYHRPVQHPIPASELRPLPQRPAKLPHLQHDFPPKSDSDREIRLNRRDAVKATSLRCYRSYRQRAWMMDELAPISGEGTGLAGSWAVTLVEALDTMLLMGKELEREYKQALAAVMGLDFSTPPAPALDVAETSSRVLGSLLSAYDLSGEFLLLQKAVELGETLLVAFDTPNRMPAIDWDWRATETGTDQVASAEVEVAKLGSFILEFTRLSQLTGDARFFDAASRVVDFLGGVQNSTDLPGLWPELVGTRQSDRLSDGRASSFSLAHNVGSVYDNILKTYMMAGQQLPEVESKYRSATDAIIESLLFRPTTSDNADILVAGDLNFSKTYDHPRQTGRVHHDSCSLAGTFALGSHLFDLPHHMSTAQRLLEGCQWMHNAVPLDLMPHTLRLESCTHPTDCTINTKQSTNTTSSSSSSSNSSDNNDIPPEISIADPTYHLSPSYITTIFTLHHLTANGTYADMAWDLFSQIQRLTRTEFGNAQLADLTVTFGLPPKEDVMPSWWMGGTLKYFYLIFSEPELGDLDGRLYTSAGHMLKRT